MMMGAMTHSENWSGPNVDISHEVELELSPEIFTNALLAAEERKRFLGGSFQALEQEQAGAAGSTQDAFRITSNSTPPPSEAKQVKDMLRNFICMSFKLAETAAAAHLQTAGVYGSLGLFAPSKKSGASSSSRKRGRDELEEGKEQGEQLSVESFDSLIEGERGDVVDSAQTGMWFQESEIPLAADTASAGGGTWSAGAAMGQ